MQVSLFSTIQKGTTMFSIQQILTTSCFSSLPNIPNVWSSARSMQYLNSRRTSFLHYYHFFIFNWIGSIWGHLRVSSFTRRRCWRALQGLLQWHHSLSIYVKIRCLLSGKFVRNPRQEFWKYIYQEPSWWTSNYSVEICRI